MDASEQLTEAQERAEHWRYKVDQARSLRRIMPPPPKMPAHMLPTARRLMVLLLWVAMGEKRRRVLGIKRCPPLTPDMKKLIAKGYCRLERNFPMHYSQEMAADLRRSTAQRVTRICVTEAGLRALAAARISQADCEYILAGVGNGALL